MKTTISVTDAKSMGRHKPTLRRLLEGLDDPGSQDPAGFGREDVAAKLREVVAVQSKEFGPLWRYLHSPDYRRSGLATRLRALKGLA